MESAAAADSSPPPSRSTRWRVVLVIAVATLVLVTFGGAMVLRAAGKVNHEPMSSAPRAVSTVVAKASSFRDSRTYVGTIEPWVEADVGPQYIAAYVRTVLVRPGDVVAQGTIVAALDCANPSALTRAAQMQAHTVDTRLRALEDESTRVQSLLDGGFVAPNEAEQKDAQSRAERAQLMEANARLTSASLGVDDCALRAPFAGEVSARLVDPGAFVRPGTTMISIVDRTTLRVVGDAPEKDYEIVSVGAPVTVGALSTRAQIASKISRRGPRADTGTRTIHFEIDVPDAARSLPAGTTGVIHIDVGTPIPATEVPAYAATVSGKKAAVFVVEDGLARKREFTVLGEIGGRLFLAPVQLAQGTAVVVEGRALLSDGERVEARPEPELPVQNEPVPSTAARGGGSGRPQ